MTEVEVGGEVQQDAAPSQVVSAGQLLREAREGRHMSIQALASALKVPVAKLQALEDDRWDLLSDVVFARAVALSICRVLQIDSAEILALLPKAGVSKLSTNPEGINTPFKDKTLRSSMSSGSDSGRGRAVKLLAVLAIVAVGGAGLYFVPQWTQSEVDAAAVHPGNVDIASSALVSAIESTQAAPAVVAAAQPVAESAAVAPAAPAAPESASALLVAALPDNTAAAPVPPTAPVAAPQPAAVPTPAADAPVAAAKRALRIAVTEQAWVQVRNAQQQVVMEKIMSAGDVYETDAARPLSVVIGNASVSNVEIDGVALDLARSSKNNVARFEVK